MNQQKEKKLKTKKKHEKLFVVNWKKNDVELLKFGGIELLEVGVEGKLEGEGLLRGKFMEVQ